MSDLIDRQAAIDDIWTVSPLAPLDREWIDRWLRQFPPAPPANTSEIPNSSDTISRQAAIDACGGYLVPANIIKQLPPAQPERIKGHWIKDANKWMCDKCGELVMDDDHNFCPNCGAKMEVTE